MKPIRLIIRNKLVIALFTTLATVDLAAESTERSFEIRFTEHHFSPSTLVVPAGQPLQISVVNASDERIEFESFGLNREKVVGPGKTVRLTFRPLASGEYDFYDDFHDDVPQGKIVARELSTPAPR